MDTDIINKIGEIQYDDILLNVVQYKSRNKYKPKTENRIQRKREADERLK